MFTEKAITNQSIRILVDYRTPSIKVYLSQQLKEMRRNDLRNEMMNAIGAMLEAYIEDPIELSAATYDAMDEVFRLLEEKGIVQ